MPKVDRAWCPYCSADALAHFATFALTLPEAGKAVGLTSRKRPRNSDKARLAWLWVH
jgi:hypothetical protein